MEGPGDVAILAALAQAAGLAVPQGTFVSCDGINNLLPRIEVNLKGSEIEALGVIVDANGRPGPRWQQVTTRFAAAACPANMAAPPRKSSRLEHPTEAMTE